MRFMLILAILPLTLGNSDPHDFLPKTRLIDLDKLLQCGLTTEPWPEAIDNARHDFSKFLGPNASHDQKLAESLAKEAAVAVAEFERRSGPVAKTLNSTAWHQFYRRLELHFNLFTCSELSTMYRKMALQAVGYAFHLTPQPRNNFLLSRELNKMFEKFFTKVITSGERMQQILSQEHATEAEVNEVRRLANELVGQVKDVAPVAQNIVAEHLLQVLQTQEIVAIEDHMLSEFYARVFNWSVSFLEQFQYDVQHKIH